MGAGPGRGGCLSGFLENSAFWIYTLINVHFEKMQSGHDFLLCMLYFLHTHIICNKMGL